MTFTPTTEQEAILAHPRNLCGRILAGPGTGKSTTVVALLEELLAADGAPRVKLLTFTRAATAELAEKVAGPGSSSVTQRPSTIHSFAISVLLQNPGVAGFPQPLRLPDEWENRHLVLETLRNRSGYSKSQLERLIREMAANWESLVPQEDPEIDPGVRARFRGLWEEHREVFGYTHVSELPYALRRALEQHENLVGLDYDLIVVDEYQDLNACDLEVLRRIGERGCLILAAGDDDQSIYGFRKAHPAGIRRFHDDYPNSRSYNLTKTLRCAKRIIAWANHVILGDPARPQERAVVEPDDEAPDGEVALLGFRGHMAEARGIAKIVRALIEREGMAPSDILVLLRGDHNRMFSNPIREQLQEIGIPYFDPSALDDILSEPRNRNVIARLRLLHDRTDSLAWATLISLERGLNTLLFLDYVYGNAAQSGQRFSDALHDLKLLGFPDAPGRTGNVATLLIDGILQWLDGVDIPPTAPEGGWGHWISEATDRHAELNPTPEFLGLIRDLDGLTEVEQTLGRFIGLIHPLGKDLAQSRSGGVRIMTMTASKGLTVKASILAAVEDDVMIGRGSQSEARRLLYVAMTRSREYVFATWASRRQGPTQRAGRGNPQARRPSRFFDDGPVRSQDGVGYISRKWPN